MKKVIKLHVDEVYTPLYTDAIHFDGYSLEMLVKHYLRENEPTPEVSKKKVLLSWDLIINNAAIVRSTHRIQDTSMPFWHEVAPIFKDIDINIPIKGEWCTAISSGKKTLFKDVDITVEVEYTIDITTRPRKKNEK